MNFGNLLHVADANKRDPKREEALLAKRNPYNLFFYAKNIIKDRWDEAEETLKKDPHYAYKYAKEIIGDRWPEAEPYIQREGLIWNQYTNHFADKFKNGTH